MKNLSPAAQDQSHEAHLRNHRSDVRHRSPSAAPARRQEALFVKPPLPQRAGRWLFPKPRRSDSVGPMPIEIVPSIDLRAGKVVRLKQGDYRQQLDYPVDPVETARKFKGAGATWMHIVDLDGAKEG